MCSCAYVCACMQACLHLDTYLLNTCTHKRAAQNLNQNASMQDVPCFAQGLSHPAAHNVLLLSQLKRKLPIFDDFVVVVAKQPSDHCSSVSV